MKKKDTFFSGMSDRRFIDFLKKAYNGYTLAELEKADQTARSIVSSRGLLDLLDKRGIIIRLKRPLSKMSDRELKDLVWEKYNGYTLSKLQDEDGSVLNLLRKRGLLDNLVDAKIIIRERRPQGVFKYASDRELVAITKREYNGLTIGELEEKGASLINHLRGRDLLDKLVESGVIIRKTKPAGFFSEATDEELIDDARQYKGKSITEIERNGGSALFVQLRKRDIVDRAVKEAGIIRRSRRHNPFNGMKDKDFVKYVAENHTGDTLTDIHYKDKTAYRELKSRNLEEELVENGIVVRKEKRARRSFAKMDNERLLNYFRENCQGMTLSSFQREDGIDHNQAYRIAYKRGLVDKLIEEGVLIRKSYGRNKTPDPVDLIEQDEKSKIIASLAGITDDVQSVAQLLVQMWPNRFPSASKLGKSLPGAIARIGKHLQPFTFQKASGLYQRIGNVPKRVYTALDDILFNIMVDQYLIPFNQDPQEALQEIGRFSRARGPISKLARKVLNYYEEVHQFAIPGYGKMAKYRRGA